MSAAIRDPRVRAGVAAIAVIVALIGGAFIGLAVEGAADFARALSAFDAYYVRVAIFTLWQAALSTLLSVAPAILVARALSRHPAFTGRGLVLRLFALPLALPAIVAALGILALLGRAGYFAGLLSWLLGGDWPGIYGLSGILVAHVFFNLPLATRLFLEALGTVPTDQWRLASQLGMGVAPSFRLIEWPVLRSALPAVAGLVLRSGPMTGPVAEAREFDVTAADAIVELDSTIDAHEDPLVARFGQAPSDPADDPLVVRYGRADARNAEDPLVIRFGRN